MTNDALLGYAETHGYGVDYIPMKENRASTIEKDGYQWDLGQLMLEGFGKDEPIGQILL